MLAVVIFCIGSVNCYAATSTGINVNYHSQKEIKDYLKSKKVNIDAETTYSKKASDVKSRIRRVRSVRAVRNQH